VVNDGDLAATHTSAQRTIVNQVRQGILAEQLGFDYWFQTEHHFQPEGAELSPNPQYVIDSIMEIKEVCGYDDFMFHAWFEADGFSAAETEARVQYFAEEIMPVLHREFGHSPNAESMIDLDVKAPVTTAA
jgi:LPS sulfotransferase NodH